jgi:O-antigen/teichoic acid export membrane protein
MRDLKERAVRGGLAKLCGQVTNTLLRIGFMVVLARLLDPQDFGIVAMVTVITGVYQIFSSAGLGAGAVQSATITDEQISTLFWINMLVGVFLALLCVATAPALAAFYREPRLSWVTIAIGTTFIFTAVGVQHNALLQRELRYITISVIDTLAQLASTVVGIVMALAGFKYWALVVATIVAAAVGAAGNWVAVPWIPARPRSGIGIGPILRMGGTWTLNNLVVYVAYNMEKLLLGRFWGADALGLYGRAYQLISFPTHTLNNTIGAIAFPAMSRVQDDPARLRSYFLQAHSLAMSMTLPITVFGALFAEDIVLIALGPKWMETVPIFRLMTPTVLIFGVINPPAWLLYSMGLQERSLKIALVIAVLMIAACAAGLPYGPRGVALAYSAAMSLWLVPHVVWCLHGTMIAPRDLFVAAFRPLLSSVIAAAIGFAAQVCLADLASPFLRLALGGSAMFSVYIFMLLFVMGQKEFYLGLLKASTNFSRS